jgi:hypothetical protein
MYLFLVLLVHLYCSNCRPVDSPAAHLVSKIRTIQMLAEEAIQAQHSARGTALDKVWQGLWTDTVPSGQRGERSGRGGPLERSNGRPRRALAKPPIGGTPNGLRSRSQPL